jgi:hypothetical protein
MFKGEIVVQTADNTLYKLILLFVFDKMEVPLSENTILDMCTGSNSWIPYMDCKIVIKQLVDESNFIYRMNNKSSSADPLYTITPEGRVCLAHFFMRIPSSLREEISEYVKENRMNYRRKQEYFSDYQKNADGSYTVILRIIDNVQPVFEVRMNVPSRTTAKWIYKKWEEKAAQAYSALYDILVD